MKTKIFLNLLLMSMTLTLFTVPFAMAEGADNLAGHYLVSGWNPGGDSSGPADYTGTVELEPWGEAWKYRGEMDGHKYIGVGLYDAASKKLSLSFISEDNTENGVTLLECSDDKLTGRWIFGGQGEGRTGTEQWIKKTE